MKAHIGLKKILTLLGLSMLLWTSVGCKKSNDNSVQISSRTRGAAITDTTQVINGQPVSSSAYITTSSGYTTNFQAAVRDLVSGQIDPSYVGSISANNGVIIRGYVEVDSNGNMVTAASKISLEIRDDFTGQSDSSGNVIPAITMTLPGSGGRAYNGKLQLTFRDSIGDILIQGSFQNGGGVVQAEVYFANFKRWDGTALPNPQYTGLGTFTIQTCGFFRCTN